MKHVPGFSRSRVVTPVIHFASLAAARDSIRVSADAGADGVFLITQGTDADGVRALVDWMREHCPQLRRGVNILGDERAAFAMDGVEVVWTDCELVNLYAHDPAASPESRIEAGRHQVVPGYLSKRTRPWSGGCAFKTHHTMSDEEAHIAARIAGYHMDVVTTSGPATGRAASVDRLRVIRQAMDLQGHVDVPLGLASGVTPENVESALEFVQMFIVASGIESAFGVLNPKRTARLVQTVRDFDAKYPERQTAG